MKIEVRPDYTPETMPDYTDVVEGAKELPCTGREPGLFYTPNVVYSAKDGLGLRLQLLSPAAFFDGPDKKYPCVVYVQGSGWYEQNCYFALPLLGRLAERGYVCAMVEYRHAGIAHFPAQIADGKNAIRFLRKNAERFHIDPESMIIMGDSSGGHTSAMIGLTCRTGQCDDPDSDVSCNVKGCIDLYGAVDVTMDCGFPGTMNHQKADSPEGRLMGYDISENMERAKEGVAKTYAANDAPPTLILHGTKDRTVFCQESVDLYEALKAAGKDTELYLIRGADHGGPAFWTPQVIDIYDGFIQRCLKG